MNAVDIITLVIGGITVSLLIALLIMMRTTYVLVRRDQQKPAEATDEDVTQPEGQ